MAVSSHSPLPPTFMKASEVLHRYAKGERDFRRVDLRGQSFQDADLSGADFSEANIRGTNFRNAVLQGANFTEAKAGLQKRWLVVQQIIAFLVSALSGGLSAFSGALIALLLTDSSGDRQAYFIAGIMVLGLLGAIFFAIIRQGFTFQAFLTIAGASAGAGVVAGAGAGVVAGASAGTVTVVVAVTVAVAVAVVVAVAVAVAVAVVVAVVVAGAVASAVAVAGAVASAGAVAIAVASAVASAVTLLSLYVAWRASKGDEKFALVRTMGVAFGAMGGTSFCGADLTGANFSHAVLKSTNFHHTNLQRTKLTQVCWRSAEKLARARRGNTYLADAKIRQLVVKLNGQDQNYDGLNLEGINLQSANLQDTSFVGTNLNHSNLQDANLSRAKLKQAQLDGTDLTGATLTGAYIEDWGITGTTKLNGVQCDYIFMRVPTKENPNPLRKPDNQREMFGDGEFADFIKPYVDTLDLYHSQDVDPRAISIALKKLSQNHPDANLEIVAMERRGQNSLNLKVRTAATVDKSELSAEYFADYNQLKASSEARLLLLTEKDDRIRSLEQMIRTALHQPTFNVQGDFMPEQNRNINVGRDLTISGSTINLGEISGNVTNTINQLPDPPDSDQPNLKALLTQLQAAIETDSDLPDTDKADLLEQVQHLAEAKTEEPAKKEGLVRKAKKMFEATLQSLPETAKIAEACSKLLPLILRALGVPV